MRVWSQLSVKLLAIQRSFQFILQPRAYFWTITKWALLHDPVTWYKITHAGVQIAKWDFQNEGISQILELSLKTRHFWADRKKF